jgi:hypothetical protein
MSLTVLYNGVRKKVKVTPASLVQQIVDDAILSFGLDSAITFDLQHNKKNVEKGQPFRFSGIPNNALLSLVEVKGSKGKAAESRIAVSVEGVGQMSATFK